MQLIGIITLIVGAILCFVSCLIYEKAYDNNQYYVERSKMVDLIRAEIGSYKRRELKADMQHRLDRICEILDEEGKDDNGVL